MSVERFKTAQSDGRYEAALDEIRSGGKRGQWIWFVFPQAAGLGQSDMAIRYAIQSPDEAIEYLRDRALSARLFEITDEVLKTVRDGIPLDALMASPLDARKLVSSLTLFESIGRRLLADAKPPAVNEPGNASRAEDLRGFVDTASRVLDLAESEGIPRCGFTLRWLAAPAAPDAPAAPGCT